jgi:ferric-dicitrate binding protein FerR (iron transport regulator)
MKDRDVNTPSKSPFGARRRLLLVALLTVLVVAAVFVAMVRPQPSGITRDKEAKIHEGMHTAPHISRHATNGPALAV